MLLEEECGLATVPELHVSGTGELLIHHEWHGVCLAVEMGHALGEAIAEEHQIERRLLTLRREWIQCQEHQQKHAGHILFPL